MRIMFVRELEDTAILKIQDADIEDTVITTAAAGDLLRFDKHNVDVSVIGSSCTDNELLIKIHGDKDKFDTLASYLVFKSCYDSFLVEDDLILCKKVDWIKEPEKGLRYNQGKLPIHLVPVSAITGLAEVLEFGAKKYSADQWRKGLSWSETYGSAMRHLLKWKEGEDRDAESGLHHLKHVLTNIAFLVEFLETHPELDDRVKKGNLNEKTK